MIFNTDEISFIEKCYSSSDSFQNFLNEDLNTLKNLVNAVLTALDQGHLSVCQKNDGQWLVLSWVKKAILLSFKLNQNQVCGDADPFLWFDKVSIKTQGWSETNYQEALFRSVPGAIVRYGAFIEKDVVLMPSFVNVGARVGQGTMIDTWSTIGSCAQIGKNCHISGGVGIGGVLEPVQAQPVIIEDHCFIGARSEIAEGVLVEEGSVISMGVFIGASTKIVHRETGEIFYGRVPAYSVVVPGVMPAKNQTQPQLACAVIVKTVDAKTRSKTSINTLLRSA